MTQRSRAMVFARTSDARAVVAALGAWLRKWDFVARDDLPAGHGGVSGEEVRELFWHPADARSPWTALAVEDLQNAFFAGYALARALPKVPVLATRDYGYGEWQVKAYLERDCILKVGDDPDHELAWVGAPLDAERIPIVTSQLGGTGVFEHFLRDALDGGADPRDLEAGLRLPSLHHGFREIREAGSAGWTYVAFVHRSSRLLR